MTTSVPAPIHPATPTGVQPPQFLQPRTASRMWTSRVIGALFLAGFLLYGSGSVLVSSVVDGPNFLAGVNSMQTTLALGAFLMIATTVADIGKAVFFYPVLERHGKRTAVAYLATMIFEMALMTVGVLALLMILPLADQAATGNLDSATAQALGSFAVDANEVAYQIGQLSLAFGALFMAALLLRAGRVPKWLAIRGLVGYATHMVGAAGEIFGYPIGLILLIPGAIFELALPAWLLTKGFTAAAFDGPLAIPTATRPG